MRSFTDIHGRKWELVLNVSSVRRVRDVTKVNLFGALREGLLQSLYDDLFVLVDVLWTLCEDQAGRQNVAKDSFEGALHGSKIAEARSALIEELADFFPSAEEREGMKKLAELLEAGSREAMELLKAKLGDPKVMEDFRRQLQELSATSTSVQESSEFIRVSSPSESSTQ